MREIKFRAWHKYRKIMSELAGLYPTRSSGIRVQLKGDSVMQPEGTFILMQYTGLKDKSGKEIWEGDIVKSPGGPIQGVVVWQAPAFVMKDKTKSGYSKIWSEFTLAPGELQFQEVIGNIYENPELLK